MNKQYQLLFFCFIFVSLLGASFGASSELTKTKLESGLIYAEEVAKGEVVSEKGLVAYSTLGKNIRNNPQILNRENFVNISKQTIEGEYKKLVSVSSGSDQETESTFLQTTDMKYELYSFPGVAQAVPGSMVQVEGYSVDGLLVAENIRTLSTPTREVTGQQDVLAITFNWANDASTPFSRAEIAGQLFSNSDSANNFYQEVSYGAVTINGTSSNVTNAYFAVGYNKNVGCTLTNGGNLDNWTTSADSLATSAGYNLGNYDRIAYVFPGNTSCGWDGLGEVGGTLPTRTWFNGANDHFVYTHEFGHNFGAGHSNRLACGLSVIDTYTSCTPTEYGDYYDVMGNSGFYHMNTVWKNIAGWIPDGKILNVTSSGTYTIEDLETSASGYYAVKIAKPNTSDYYYFEYRQATGFDSALPAGVTKGLIGHLYTKYFDGTYYDTYLLDMSPATGWTDIALSDTSSFMDNSNNIRVRQVSHGVNSVSFEVSLFSVSPVYMGDYGNWNVAATKFVVSGDYNADGKEDVAAMYDYGNGKIGIWSFESNGTTLAPRAIYMGDYGNWNVAATKFVVSGDYNADGKEDVAAMYDYGNGKIGIWSFESNGTTLAPRAIYMGDYGNWNVAATKFVVSGDYNADGKEDVAAMYDYGNGKIGIWSFESNGTTLAPRAIYMGDYGNWNVAATKFVVSGDYNADGKEDVAAMYDYGNGKIGIWSFESNGTTLAPRAIYMGDYGNWNVAATKFVVSGDYNADGKEDVAAMYDYGNGKIGIWSFESNGTTLAPRAIYMGDYGNWNVAATKFVVSGDYNADGKEDVAAMYDYGNGKIGIWSFESKI